MEMGFQIISIVFKVAHNLIPLLFKVFKSSTRVLS